MKSLLAFSSKWLLYGITATYHLDIDNVLTTFFPIMSVNWQVINDKFLWTKGLIVNHFYCPIDSCSVSW